MGWAAAARSRAMSPLLSFVVRCPTRAAAATTLGAFGVLLGGASSSTSWAVGRAQCVVQPAALMELMLRERLRRDSSAISTRVERWPLQLEAWLWACADRCAGLETCGR
eukprot:SAG11_NODE_1418_length_4962_cov_3.782644_3_plen_109_part_00